MICRKYIYTLYNQCIVIGKVTDYLRIFAVHIRIFYEQFCGAPGHNLRTADLGEVVNSGTKDNYRTAIYKSCCKLQYICFKYLVHSVCFFLPLIAQTIGSLTRTRFPPTNVQCRASAGGLVVRLDFLHYQWCKIIQSSASLIIYSLETDTFFSTLTFGAHSNAHL